MDQEETLFRQITEQLIRENNEISAGKMMSSPAIMYKGKVIAFYYDREMIFRLGKAFDPSSFGITRYRNLNPFKNKPPMTTWFHISYDNHEQWQALTRYALHHMIEEMSR